MKTFHQKIFIFILFTFSIFSQDTQSNSKIIYLNHFNPYKSQKSDLLANKIFKKLEEDFKANGFQVRESNSELKSLLKAAKENNAKFLFSNL